MPSDELVLVRVDAVLDVAAQALTDYLTTVLTEEITESWDSALVAAADYTAFATTDEPSPEDVEAVSSTTKRAAFLAALLMVLYLGFTNEQAMGVTLQLTAPGSLLPEAIKTRLRTLRQIINARVVATFAESIRQGVPRDEALARALKQANNSARIFAEAEALSAVNSGIGSFGGYLSQNNVTVTKTWRTRRDPKVRETHAGVEGQEVPYGSYFNVAGWPMEFPGDVRVPPGLWANCRCIMVIGSPSSLGDFQP